MAPKTWSPGRETRAPAYCTTSNCLAVADPDGAGAAQRRGGPDPRRLRVQRGGIRDARDVPGVEGPGTVRPRLHGADLEPAVRPVDVGEVDELVRLVVAARDDPALLAIAELGARRNHDITANHIDRHGRRVRRMNSRLVHDMVGERVGAREGRGEGDDAARPSGDRRSG